MPNYDIEEVVEHIRRSRDSYSSINVRLCGIIIPWRSWRLLAQHVNRAVGVHRYTPMDRVTVHDVLVLSDRHGAEGLTWDKSANQSSSEGVKNPYASSTSTVHRLKHGS